jgi:hypothetical protein
MLSNGIVDNNILMNRKSSTPTIINTAEITTVLKHTNDHDKFSSFSDFSRLAMEEAIVKKIKGIIAVKVNLKYIS